MPIPERSAGREKTLNAAPSAEDRGTPASVKQSFRLEALTSEINTFPEE